MSNYTKGPWTLKHVNGSNFANQRFEIRGMLGERPGGLPIFNKDTSAIDGTTICCSPADAALITAAPELLEACETFSKWLAHDRDGFDCERHDRSTAEGEEAWKEWWHEGLALCELAQQQAKAAIAKARGES